MISNPEHCADRRGARHVQQVLNLIANAMGTATPSAAIAAFRGMMEETEPARPASGSKASDVEKLASSVNPVRLKNNPIELSQMAIMPLYSKIVE